MRDGLGNVQSVLLLGGTSEIGQSIVRRLLITDGGGRPGRRAVLAARTPDACAAFAEELRAGGVTVETSRFDADDVSTHAAVLDLAAAGGDLDVVLLAWGLLGDDGAGDGQDVRGAVQLARTNYVGVISAGLEAARVLRRQGHGTIVYLSSVAGERVRKANFVYGSTKAGADAFMQGLADSLAGTGVDVLVVRPGFVRTKMTSGMQAAPFATDADTVAEATARGLRRGSTTVWAPAVLRPVFVVLRHLPRPVWRRMPR